MKSIRILVFLMLTLASCTPAVFSPPGEGSQELMPYLTLTSQSTASPAETHVALPTPPPQPTPTPLVHEVALGETISQIALRYGLDMGAVLAANPQIDPYTLTVGTKVIIPLEDIGARIGLAAEPLALEVEAPQCAPTLEGGLWCFALVRNPLAEPAAGVTVAVALLDPNGEEAARLNTPLILHKIDAGDALPALAYFPPPLPEYRSVSASLVSALSLTESGREFLPVEIVNEEVRLDGRSALASGELAINAEKEGEVEIQAAALAYDAAGNLAGIRRFAQQVTVEGGNEVDFEIEVYSTGADIASVRIRAEAYTIKQ